MAAQAGFPGCCIGRIHFNFGGAHGHRDEPSAKALAKKMISSLSLINVALTNSNQTVTRQQLDELGFKYQNVSRSMRLHYATSNEIKESPPMREVLEEQEKERQEKIRKQREMAEARAKERLKSLKRVSRDKTKVSFRDIEKLSRYTQGIPPREVIRQTYGVDIQFRYNTWYSYYPSEIARSVNRALERKAKRDELKV